MRNIEMSNSTMVQDATTLAPPMTVTGLTVLGVGLPEVVLILTAVYTLFMVIKNIIPAWESTVDIYKCIKKKVTKK